MAEIVKIERNGIVEQYYVGELVYDNSADPSDGFEPTFFDPTSSDGFTLDDVKRLRRAAYPNGEPEEVAFYFAGYLESPMDHRSPRDHMRCLKGKASSKEIDQALETSKRPLGFARQISEHDIYSVYRMGILLPVAKTTRKGKEYDVYAFDRIGFTIPPLKI
jgi:hypothetical protein